MSSTRGSLPPDEGAGRVVAEQLRRELGTTVLRENRPRAGMMLATSEAARAAPDGHTLLYSPSTPFAQAPHTVAKMPFDPLRDFTPISLGCVGPLVLVVHGSIPARSLKELVDYARAHPGELSCASFGNGSSSQG